MPRLSILLSNYNHAEYVGYALDAMVTQSRPPDEIVVIDDGSTDDSLEVIKSYMNKYPYIKLKIHEKNMGLMISFNELFTMATGNYIYCASSTDYALPGFFEKAMAMAESHPQAGVIFGKIVAMSQNNKEILVDEVTGWQKSLYATPEQFLKEYLERENAMHCLISGTIFKKSCFDEVGGYIKELKSWSDGFSIRATGLKYGACYIAEKCAAYRRLPGSYSEGVAHERLEIIDKAAELMRSDKFKDRFPENYVKNFKTQANRVHRHPLLYSAWWRISNPVKRFIAKLKNK